jgi:hypothetical protein
MTWLGADPLNRSSGLPLQADAAKLTQVERRFPYLVGRRPQNLKPKPSKGPCVSTSYLNSVALSPSE